MLGRAAGSRSPEEGPLGPLTDTTPLPSLPWRVQTAFNTFVRCTYEWAENCICPPAFALRRGHLRLGLVRVRWMNSLRCCTGSCHASCVQPLAEQAPMDHRTAKARPWPCACSFSPRARGAGCSTTTTRGTKQHWVLFRSLSLSTCMRGAVEAQPRLSLWTRT